MMTKTRLLFLAKLILITLGIYYFARVTNFQELKTIILHSHVAWLMLAFLLKMLVVGLYTLRNYLGLKIYRIDLPGLQCLKIRFQSLFYEFILPVSGGSNVSQFIKTSAFEENASKKTIFSALLMDRCIGCSSVLTLGCLGLYFSNINVVIQLNPTQLILMLCALMGLLLIYLRYKHNLSFMFPQHSNRVFIIMTNYLLSLIMQAVYVAATLSIALGLGIDINYWALMFVNSIVILLQTIPLSLMGINIGTLSMPFLLTHAGLNHEHAIAITLGVYCLNLFVGMLGGMLELTETVYRSPLWSKR